MKSFSHHLTVSEKSCWLRISLKPVLRSKGFVLSSIWDMPVWRDSTHEAALSRLETIKVSRDSADQRLGRAGRLEPGICYRLWTAAEHQTLLQRTTPEILEADLSSLALELARWGTSRSGRTVVARPTSLQGAYAHARELLKATRGLGRTRDTSLHMGSRWWICLSIHDWLIWCSKPKDSGLGSLACDLAVLLSERDCPQNAALGSRTQTFGIASMFCILPKNRTEERSVNRSICFGTNCSRRQSN